MAADNSYSSGTVTHTFTILAPSNLAFGTFSDSIPQMGGAVTLTATSDSGATITWGISGTDDSPHHLRHPQRQRPHGDPDPRPIRPCGRGEDHH